MARVLPLYRMMPRISFEGTVLVDEALPYSEVAQHIKEAMEPTKDSAGRVLDIVYPVPGHPPMRPEPRFFEFVSPLLPCSFLFPRSPFFNTCFMTLGPAEGAGLQGQPGSVTEGQGRGGGESTRGRAGQESKGGDEEGETTEAGGTGSGRGREQ